MSRTLLAVAAGFTLMSGGMAYRAAQPSQPTPAVPTLHTPKATPTATPAVPGPATTAATLTSLRFLTGTWEGKMGEDAVEETWSAPMGDTIIGMFRWQSAAGATTMFELLAIKQEADGPALRLRHFDKDFNPWKSEAEGVTPLRLTTNEPTRAVFTNSTDKGGLRSVEYQCPSSDVLKIAVEFLDAKRPTLRFTLGRVHPVAAPKPVPEGP